MGSGEEDNGRNEREGRKWVVARRGGGGERFKVQSSRERAGAGRCWEQVGG